MDLSRFSKEFEKAGLSATKEYTERFTSPESLTLPFMVDNYNFYKINLSYVKDANYIDKTKRVTSANEIKEKCKCVHNSLNPNEDVSEEILGWMLGHVNRLRIVNRGGYKRKENKFGVNIESDFSERYEKDTEYGLCVLGFHIEYSRQRMGLRLDVNHSNIKGVSTESWYKPGRVSRILDELNEISEFIPVDLHEEETGVCWNFLPNHYDMVSSYGENILSSENDIKRLKIDGFFKDEVKINPKAWYYFICGKDGRCYLKRDFERSPRRVVC